MSAEKYSFNYFEKQIKEELVRRREKSIDRNQEHNEFVCMFANSFYGNNSSLVQSTGFKTVFLEPLFDVDSYLNGEQSKNFDLLLYNKVKKHLIFLEFKTSFSSIADLLNDFQDSIEIVKMDFNTKLASKFGLNFDDFSFVEFVLVVPREQSQPLKDRIIVQQLNEVIVWETSPITSSQVDIKHDVSNLNQMLSKKQTHLDNTFRNLVYNGLTLKKPAKIFNFLLNSDPFQRLIYFVTLFRSFNIDEFNYLKIKDSIFLNEHSFLAYNNPEQSMNFVYKDLIRTLSEMECLKVKKQSDEELEIFYELNVDRRLTGGMLRNSLRKAFFKTLVDKKELYIKNESIRRYNEYHGQDALF